MKKLFYGLMFSIMTLMSSAVFAEVAVIVNPANGNSLSDSDISRIYLGKSKSFGDGTSIEAVNQQPDAGVTEAFNEKVVKKSSSQLKAYWSKLVFTGKGTPPKELDSDEAVLDFVAKNPGAIGYIDASKVNDSVKVIGKY